MSDWTELSYSPGRWVAVAAHEQWLLVDLAAEDPVVRRCWKLMSERSGVDAVLDALLAGGMTMTPGFVLVSLRGDERRVVSRFPAVATMHQKGEQAVEIAGAQGASWADVLIDHRDLEGVTLRGLPNATSGVELPMGAGVTTAGVVHVSAGTPSTAAPALSRSEPVRVTDEPAPSSSQSPSVQKPAVGSSPAAPSPPAAVVPPAVPSLPLPPAPPAPPTAAASVQDPQTAVWPEDAPSYDFLFGATMRPDDMPAADRHTDRSGAPEPPPPARPTTEHPPLLEATLTPPVPSEAPVTPAPPSPAASGSGLIDAVPWLSGVADPPREPPTIVPTTATDQVGAASAPQRDATRDVSETVNRAELSSAAHAPVSTGPTVLAGYCPSRHLSPPHAARCRVCSAPMSPQEPFEIARPALGVLRLESGDVIPLDRGVVLGRSPEVPDGGTGDRPHVLRLASPENDISRTHAEVVLDGWNVYVRDFGSMNGTVVTLPGLPPERLRDNNPLLLTHGAIITLADEVSIAYEVTV